MKGDHRMEIIGVYIFAIPTWWSINKRKKVLYTWYLKHYWFMTVDLKAEKKFQMEAQASGLEADCVCVLNEVIVFVYCCFVPSAVIIRPIVSAILAASTWLLLAVVMLCVCYCTENQSVMFHVPQKARVSTRGRNQRRAPIFLQDVA